MLLSQKNLLEDPNISINGVFEQLPGLVFIKNINSIYIAANTYSAHLYGFKNVHQLYGCSDFEVKGPVAESAEDFRKEDKKVLETGKQLASIHINEYINNEIHIFSVKKAPVKNNNGDIIGISCVADEILNQKIGQSIFNLFGFSKLHGHKIKKLNVMADDKKKKKLSVRESEIIFYLSRGLSSKEVALLMELSVRTIESYTESIKNKLNCYSRNDLIVYCLSNGLSNIIPRSIFQRCLKKIIPL